MAKIVYITVISLLTIILTTEGYPNYIDIPFTTFILVINLLSFLFFFFRKEENANLKKQHLRTSYLFLLGFIIVHFQMYIDIILENVSANNYSLLINNRIALKSLLISSIAFNSFCLGYVLIDDKIDHVITNNNFKNATTLNTKLLFFLAMFFLLMYFSPIGESWALLFECAISALLIIKARNIIITHGFGVNIKKALLFFKEEILLLSFYLVYLLITGERGIIIFNVLFLTGTLLYVTKLRLGRTHILLLVGIAASTLTILGVARKFKDEGSFFEKIKTALNDNSESYYYPNSFLSNTKELASSGRILNIAVNEIEQGKEHTYGLFALQDLMLLVPSLKGTMIKTFNIPYFLTSSPQYFTYIDLGRNPAWGVGTSCVADTYTDFGVIGVAIIFFAFGFFVRKLELVMYKKELGNFVILAISLLVFSYSVYISRGTLIYSVTSKITYITAFIYITILINKLRTRSITL